MTPAINIQDEVSMTLSSIEISDKKLIFDYTVINNSLFPLYLLNSLFDQEAPAGFQLDSNIIYAQLAPGPILSLSKQLMPAPLGLDPAAAEVPFVSILESRWEMTETLRLPLPITQRYPSKPEEDIGHPATIPHFTFTLGYVVEDQPLALEEHLLPGGSRQFKLEYTGLNSRQRLKRSAPVTAAVPVFIAEQATKPGFDH